MIAVETGSALPDPTGVGVYISQLARHLTAIQPERVRLIGVRRDGPLAESYRPELDAWLDGRYLAWLQYGAERQANAAGAEICHYTNALAPIVVRRPFVVTIQDLSLLRYPRFHPLHRIATLPLMVSSAHRARLVLVPSTFTRDEVTRLLRVPSRRVVVVPLAPQIHPTSDPHRQHDLLESLGLEEGQYVLSVATLEPRKNLRRVVAAFEQFLRTHPSHKLVLLGAAGWRTDALNAALQASEARHRIVRTGYVSNEAKQELMRRCATFVYVSLYEGFGLPVVEAMAAGAPIVTSNTSSMPEAAGGAAVLVNPYRAADIAAGMRTSVDARSEWIARGLERVRGMSWSNVAVATLEAYDAVLNERGAARS